MLSLLCLSLFEFSSDGLLTSMHFFRLKCLRDLLDVAPSGHGDGTSFFISLIFYS